MNDQDRAVKPVLLHARRGWWMVQDRAGDVCSGKHADKHEAVKDYWKKVEAKNGKAIR